MNRTTGGGNEEPTNGGDTSTEPATKRKQKILCQPVEANIAHAEKHTPEARGHWTPREEPAAESGRGNNGAEDEPAWPNKKIQIIR